MPYPRPSTALDQLLQQEMGYGPSPYLPGPAAPPMPNTAYDDIYQHKQQMKKLQSLGIDPFSASPPPPPMPTNMQGPNWPNPWEGGPLPSNQLLPGMFPGFHLWQQEQFDQGNPFPMMDEWEKWQFAPPANPLPPGGGFPPALPGLMNPGAPGMKGPGPGFNPFQQAQPLTSLPNVPPGQPTYGASPLAFMQGLSGYS